MSRYGIKPLNLKQALELYDILGEFIPDKSENEHILNFVGKIVNNIVEAKSSAFIDALVLMTKHSVLSMKAFSLETQFEMFSIGLITNDISHLKKFCEDIGYGR